MYAVRHFGPNYYSNNPILFTFETLNAARDHVLTPTVIKGHFAIITNDTGKKVFNTRLLSMLRLDYQYREALLEGTLYTIGITYQLGMDVESALQTAGLFTGHQTVFEAVKYNSKQLGILQEAIVEETARIYSLEERN